MGTWLTETFGLSVPVVQAPMANVSGGRLTGAISVAGGLGMLGAGSAVSAEWIRTEGAVAAATGKPYGVGLMAWSVKDHPDHLDAVLELKPALVSLSFGDYTPYVEPLRAAGIVVATQAGTVADAREAIAVGVDAIVVRGAEAGGHGRNEVATLPLLQAILDLTDLAWQGVHELAERLTGIDDWAEAIFAANIVFEPLVGELFRSQLVQQAAPRNGDFVTPTVIGAAEFDFAERDLRYTTAMFELLTGDKEFAGHNKAIMQGWLSDWTQQAIAAARALQPLWSQPDAKPPRFEDGLDRVKSRFSGILASLGLEEPKELAQ